MTENGAGSPTRRLASQDATRSWRDEDFEVFEVFESRGIQGIRGTRTLR